MLRQSEPAIPVRLTVSAAGAMQAQWRGAMRTERVSDWRKGSTSSMRRDNPFMRKALMIGVAAAALSLGLVYAAEKKVGVGPSFKGPVGLQLYSLRAAFAKDVPGTLDKVK